MFSQYEAVKMSNYFKIFENLLAMITFSNCPWSPLNRTVRGCYEIVLQGMSISWKAT